MECKVKMLKCAVFLLGIKTNLKSFAMIVKLWIFCKTLSYIL